MASGFNLLVIVTSDATPGRSSLFRDTWVAIDALQGHAAGTCPRESSGAKMVCDHVPDRGSLLLVDGGPARDLVVLFGFEPMSVIESEV
jgi:hypothetical protein